MSTAVLYTRVSTELKAAVQSYADAHALSLSTATAILLARGLEMPTMAYGVSLVQFLLDPGTPDRIRAVADAYTHLIQQAMGEGHEPGD